MSIDQKAVNSEYLKIISGINRIQNGPVMISAYDAGLFNAIKMTCEKALQKNKDTVMERVIPGRFDRQV